MCMYILYYNYNNNNDNNKIKCNINIGNAQPITIISSYPITNL